MGSTILNQTDDTSDLSLKPTVSPLSEMGQGRSLRLLLGRNGSEDVHHDFSLQWDEDISSFYVLIFQPYFILKRIWIIDDLAKEEWRLKDAITGDSSLRLVIYGVKLTADDGLMKHFKVVNSTSMTECSLTSESLTCSLDLEPHQSSNSILSTGMNSLAGTLQEELKISTKFSPPANYNISPQEKFPEEIDVLMFLGKDTNEYIIQTQMSSQGVNIPFTLQPRTRYQGLVIQVTTADSSDIKSYQCQRTSSVFTVKSVMLKEDLERLQQKAEQHMRTQLRYPSTHEVKIMFRNKPRRIMDEIMDQHNGLMKKYIKDNNGDPYSPVNGNIHGLFFNVSLDPATNSPPNFSFFGDRRLHVPVEALFTDDTNLYFTDFYCHNKAHYVTVIMTKKDSETDAFCQESLLKLDQRNNPFLFKTGEASEVKVYTTWTLHVEVLYTEDVDITELQSRYGSDNVRFTNTTTKGKGESLPGGIPKRSSCTICNL